jgi:hypothetical protein
MPENHYSTGPRAGVIGIEMEQSVYRCSVLFGSVYTYREMYLLQYICNSMFAHGY